MKRLTFRRFFVFRRRSGVVLGRVPVCARLGVAQSTTHVSTRDTRFINIIEKRERRTEGLLLATLPIPRVSYCTSHVEQLVTMALVSTEAQLRSMSPGPERSMTMNLVSSGPCTVSKGATSYGRTVRRMNTRDNHTTADVDGARTFVRTSTLTNKPDSHGVAVRQLLIQTCRKGNYFS